MAVVANDAYLAWENTEAVTLTTVRGLNGATETEYEIATAKKSGINVGNVAPGDLQMLSEGAMWRIPVALMTDGVEIQPGDTIADASSVVWTVLSVQPPQWGANGSSWRCMCRENK